VTGQDVCGIYRLQRFPKQRFPKRCSVRLSRVFMSAWSEIHRAGMSGVSVTGDSPELSAVGLRPIDRHPTHARPVVQRAGASGLQTREGGVTRVRGRNTEPATYFAMPSAGAPTWQPRWSGPSCLRTRCSRQLDNTSNESGALAGNYCEHPRNDPIAAMTVEPKGLWRGSTSALQQYASQCCPCARQARLNHILGDAQRFCHF
jgi:hypothetical protein